MGVENNMQNNFGCKLVAVLDMNKLKLYELLGRKRPSFKTVLVG